jgi:hypothetical protein
MRNAAHTFLRASFLSHSSTLLCVRFGGGMVDLLLGVWQRIAGFFP